MKKLYTFLCAFLLTLTAIGQVFSPGNLLVVRTGDNTATVSAGTYSTIYLDEYTTDGALVNSHTITGLVGDGGSTNEGFFQLSPNGKYLAVAGYAKNAGSSRSISTTGTGDLAKVQIYGAAGVSNVLRSYTFPAGVFSTGDQTIAGQVTNSRLSGTVALNDGTGFYAGGGSTNTNNGGIFYVNNNESTGSTEVFSQVQTVQSNLRIPGIFNGQLFTSGNAAALGNAAAIRLGIFSTAMPSDPASAGLSNLQGADFSIAVASGGVPLNICQFVMADASTSIAGNDVLFATDDGSTAGNKGGIKKYVKDASGNWNLKYQLYTGTGLSDVNNLKFRGLVGQVNSQNKITLFATAFDPVNNTYKVLKFNDEDMLSSSAAPALTTLLTSPSANYIFKGISFTPGSSLLPLKLSSFNIEHQFDNVLLTWTTEQEKNTSRFEVERSLDGKIFGLRMTKKSMNTDGKHTYSTTDKIDFYGTAYYRLKMIDLDGTFTYSNIKPVQSKKMPVFTLYPNPVNDQLTISHEKITSYARFEILSMDGKILQSKSTGPDSSSTVINLRSLPKGSYIVKAILDGSLVSKKIIKN